MTSTNYIYPEQTSISIKASLLDGLPSITVKTDDNKYSGTWTVTVNVSLKYGPSVKFTIDITLVPDCSNLFVNS